MNRTQCMNCASSNLENFIDLGMQPNGNNFPEIGDQNDELFFPIEMVVCKECWQVQINEFPSQDFLFSDHPYITGVNVPIVEHFKSLASNIINKLELPNNSLVIDIGCNDGTLLRFFEDLGMRTLGVDPGKRTGELAQAQGTTVFRTFWNQETGKLLRKLCVFPDLITATAVFYHLPDLHDFIKGLREVMLDHTTFVLQCVNLLDLIERNQFDHFYHEHSCIHAISPLKRLFKAHKMRILDVEFSDIHGGSFIAFVGLNSHPMKANDSLKKAIDKESAFGLHKIETYKEFAARSKKNAIELFNLLKKLKMNGKRIYALGAPVKGNTLLNYAKITPELVEFATEINQFKIGRLTPGTHIPIIDERKILKDPDYYLILSWNFLDYLIAKYKSFLLNGGKFIVPVPSIRILGFESVG